MSFCRFRLLLPFFLFTFAEDKLHLGIGYKLRQSRVDEFLLMQAAKPSDDYHLEWYETQYH